MTSALIEVNRVLKLGGKATIVFHSTSAKIWNALQGAYTNAGFGVTHVGILDKTQGSFKQVTTSGAVKGDPVFLLTKRRGGKVNLGAGLDVADELWNAANMKSDPEERTARRLYSRIIAHHLVNHQQVSVDAGDFYRWHSKRKSLEEGANAGN